MEIFLDGEKIEEVDTELGQEEILNIIEAELEQSLVTEIYVDDARVSVTNFKNEDLKLDKYKKVEFKSKKVDQLLDDSLKDCRDYLPQLKQDIAKISQLLQEDKRARAGNKLLLTLEGIDWYTGVLDNLKSRIDEEKLTQKIQNKIEEISTLISRILKLQKKGKKDKMAQLLSGEITAVIEDFMKLNEELISR